MPKQLQERFWPKVTVGEEDECWLWNASLNPDGYGQIWVRELGRPIVASRVAYTLCNGEIPEGIAVLHKCDNPPCCNPRHLFLGTQTENMADRQRKGRQARNEHCGATTHSDILIQNVREANGTQQEIADRFGISQPHVSRIKAGLRRAV